MQNKHRKLLAFLLCAALVLTLAGVALVQEEHDHEHEYENEALNAVLASPIVTTFSSELVPLAAGGGALAGAEGAPQGDPPADPAPVEPAPVEPAPADPAPTETTTQPPVTTEQPANTQAPETTTQPPATAAPAHVHNWVQKIESSTYDCYYGTTQRGYYECSICGEKGESNMWRPDEGAWPKGNHNYTIVTETDSGCPSHPNVRKECGTCHNVVFEQGGHNWSGWTQGGTACESYQERHCLDCRQTERQVLTSGHNWVWKEEPATCSKPGSKWQQCSRCGATQNRQAIPTKPHKWEADDGNCMTPVKCAVCGKVVQAAMTHKWSSTYSHDNTQHWKQCTNPGCTQRSEVGKHTGTTSKDCTRLSSCSVCGIAGGASGMQHNFDGSGGYIIASNGGHQIRCSNPGCTQVSSIIPHDKPSASATSCTEGQDCVCGYPLVRAQGNHAFGPWTSTSTGHSRTCTKCGYVDSGSHTGKASSGGCTGSVICSTCGYVLSQGYSSHSFGVWMSNGSTHYRTCTHPGCTAIQSAAHTGGKGNCTTAPVCSICGAAYGSKVASSHVGGTELRNDKPAEQGKDGYTGDTYCLGCGKKISSGTTIKALSASHTHSYTGSWKSDSGSHWHQCSCGEHGDVAAHSFANGKCTVCGAADPNYKTCFGGNHVGGTELRDAKPASVGKDGYTGDLYCSACGKKIATGTKIEALDKNHEHEYSVAWRSDGTSHWKDCTCGEITRKANHSFSKGVCTVCGAADPEAETAHTHSYGSYHSNGQYHWRECTICGFQAEKTAHVVLNGSCMTCGYKMPVIETVKDVSTKDWYYSSVKQVLEAGLLSGGKEADENTSFKPAEKVVLSDVVDAIYRMAGSPAASTETKFKDVKTDDYYASAASWVTDNNIVDIYGDSFDGDKVTTLQEMVTFLWRFAKTAGWNVDANGQIDIENADEIDEWSADAMAWAAKVGLIEGIDGNVSEALTPDGVVTRAEAAAILGNFMNMISENGLPEIENGVEEVAV